MYMSNKTHAPIETSVGTLSLSLSLCLSVYLSMFQSVYESICHSHADSVCVEAGKKHSVCVCVCVCVSCAHTSLGGARVRRAGASAAASSCWATCGIIVHFVM